MQFLVVLKENNIDFAQQYCFTGYIYPSGKLKMDKHILRDNSKKFAIEIIKYVQTLKERVLGNQLLRAGTSIGANIHEAHYAQSTSDFISKFEIALKECYECEYWLELLFATSYLEESQYKHFISECGGIRRMLISSVKTLKEKQTK